MTKNIIVEDRVLTIKLPVYGARFKLKVIVTENVNEARERYANEIGFPWKGDAHALVSTDEARVWMFLPPLASPGVIAHESWHVVVHLWEYIGAKKVDEELDAYHLEYIVDKIWKHIRPEGYR